MSDDPSTRSGYRPAAEPMTRKGPLSAGGSKPARRLGLLAGKIHIPDDFDDPLPDEILAEFEGR
jgi:hypothetical protein